MARPCRVLILYESPLFGAGIRSMLEDQKDLEVMAERAVPGLEGEQVARSRPRVLVLEGDPGQPVQPIGWEYEKVPVVIRLSLASGAMRVSARRRVQPAGARQLLEAVAGRGLTRKGRGNRQEGGLHEPWSSARGRQTGIAVPGAGAPGGSLAATGVSGV